MVESHNPNLCFYCLKPFQHLDDITVDHIIPKSKGGANNHYNKLPAHKKCNRRKDDLLPVEISALISIPKGTLEYRQKAYKFSEFIQSQVDALQAYVVTMGTKLYKEAYFNKPAIKRHKNKAKVPTKTSHHGNNLDKVKSFLKKGQPGIPLHLLNRISSMQDAYRYDDLMDE